MVVDIITFRSCQSSLFLPPEVSTSPSRVSANPRREGSLGVATALTSAMSNAARTTFAESPAPFVSRREGVMPSSRRQSNRRSHPPSGLCRCRATPLSRTWRMSVTSASDARRMARREPRGGLRRAMRATSGEVSHSKMRDTRGSSRRVEGVGLLVWSADGRRHRGKRRDGDVSRPEARTIFAGPFALRPCEGA